MKKLFSILLSICIVFSLVSVSAYATTGDEIKSTYDYNGDGEVNLTDARTVLRVSANLEAPRDGYDYDVDNDGFVTVTDVKAILSIVLGIDVTISDDEYLLSLFKTELNNVKDKRPGFTKTSTTQCLSMLVTTKNAPASELNYSTPVEFKVYANASCDYMENLLNGPAGLLLPSSQKAQVRTQIAELRKQATEIYQPQITTKTVNRYGSHYYHFPVNNLGNSCFLELSDIKSIECYEEDGYIIRKVTMNTDKYVGDEFPTGNEGSTERWKTISYGKVFNIPDFDETSGTKKTSNLNSVTFKDGVIISKVDKLTGIPVQVDYSYSYVADVSTIPEKNTDGTDGLQMDSVTTATVSETYVINPITVN